MFIKKKFRNRHRILHVLQEYLDQNNRPDKIDLMEIELSFMEVVQKSNLTEKEVYREIDYLEKEKEIHIDEINFSTYYMILKQGSVSYFDKKYLELGRKNFRDNLFDNLKIISSFILLLIAVITFIVNLLETRKNRTEIEKLKNDIIILKDNRQK